MPSEYDLRSLLIATNSENAEQAAGVYLVTQDSAGVSSVNTFTTTVLTAQGNTGGAFKVLANGYIGFNNATPITQPAAITKPAGGGTADAEARTAINSIIDLLHNYGLTA